MTYYATVAIISAMDEEAAHIADALSDVTVTKAASLNVIRGTYKADSGRTLEVGVTVGGMGLVNAAATTQYLVDLLEPDAIIFSGIAGNLNKELHTNDIVLGNTLRYLDTDMRLVGQWTGTEEFHSDPNLMHMAEEALEDMGIKHMQGTIASGNYFVDSPAKIKEVKDTTQADAVEMEGAAVAHVAERNNVPSLVIRAMSDNADTDYEEFKDFDVTEYADTAAKLAVAILKRM
ncbi:5'-methylthioadenosine/S-adenosylhomocysteine nucleosidase [Bifidobacterium magnum]|uniref:adenosylhomocysteine nucleosidase n=1 Tax=Bifidobacterium magnum TaxID=1692 RepID=A0A087BB81_9BIFI|nr:5'-methylthioadenosine/S-adenosylhomocysteine nucleosidase [Bifidobacterium magnum]KFI68281.1 5'-methylthioadenosine nucleosidase [Bifidobacterium magnum]